MPFLLIVKILYLYVLSIHISSLIKILLCHFYSYFLLFSVFDAFILNESIDIYIFLVFDDGSMSNDNNGQWIYV